MMWSMAKGSSWFSGDTVYREAAIEQLRREGHRAEESDLAYLSPCRYKHINPCGQYDFEMSEDLRTDMLRPLRTR